MSYSAITSPVQFINGREEVNIAAAFINANAQILAEAVVSYTCHHHSSCDSAARGAVMQTSHGS